MTVYYYDPISNKIDTKDYFPLLDSDYFIDLLNRKYPYGWATDLKALRYSISMCNTYIDLDYVKEAFDNFLKLGKIEEKKRSYHV